MNFTLIYFKYKECLNLLYKIKFIKIYLLIFISNDFYLNLKYKVFIKKDLIYILIYLRPNNSAINFFIKVASLNSNLKAIKICKII